MRKIEALIEEPDDDFDITPEDEELMKQLLSIMKLKQNELHQKSSPQPPDNNGNGDNEATDGI